METLNKDAIKEIQDLAMLFNSQNDTERLEWILANTERFNKSFYIELDNDSTSICINDSALSEYFNETLYEAGEWNEIKDFEGWFGWDDLTVDLLRGVLKINLR